MRKLGFFALIALALCLAPVCYGRLMAVDLGGEFLKVSVVAPGRVPISIAINEMSRRKTPVLAGFVDGQRVLGEEAVTLSVRHPDKFFKRMRDLIGKPADDASVKALLANSLLDYEILADERRGTLRIKVPGVERPFSIEELLASEFFYAKQIAEAHTSATITDVVVLVPPHYGPPQRTALMNAVELSGLNLLSLMNTHAAAALQYGIERDFSDKTEDVILYDVASTDVVAALVRFSAYAAKGSSKKQSQFQVLDVVWRENVGASNLDTILLKHFAAKFVEQHGTDDVLQIPKVRAKMAKPIRRTKEMLSANTEAPFMVEELHNGIDFASSLTRDQFEELAGSYWDDVKAPLVELLERNNITSAENITIQLLGGGSRIPRVKQELSSVLEGLSLEKQLDADEAVAMGGGLLAANMSTTFRLRQFGMTDGIIYPVSIVVDPQDMPSSYSDFFPANGGKELAPFLRKLGSKRKVSFTDLTADSFSFSLVFSGDRKPCCHSTDTLAKFTVSGISEVIEKYGEAGKVSLHFEIDSSGLLFLTLADATVQVEETIEVDKMVPDEDAEAAAAAEAEKNKDKENATANNSTTPRAPKMKKIKVPQKVLKPRVMELKVEVESFGILSMSNEDMDESKVILDKFAKLEAEKKNLEMAKNTLESYIINTRSALQEPDVQMVTTDQQRQEFLDALTAAEDWLYEDEADTATADVFMNKMLDLQKIGDPIKARVHELIRRPERVKAAFELTDLVVKATNSWPEVKPWLNETHVGALKERSNEFRSWLDEVTAQQEATPLHEEPVFSVKELQERFEVVSKMFALLNSMKNPKPAPTPQKNVTATESKNISREAPTAGSGEDAQAGASPETTSEGAGEAGSPEADDSSTEQDQHDELR